MSRRVEKLLLKKSVGHHGALSTGTGHGKRSRFLSQLTSGQKGGACADTCQTKCFSQACAAQAPYQSDSKVSTCRVSSVGHAENAPHAAASPPSLAARHQALKLCPRSAATRPEAVELEGGVRKLSGRVHLCPHCPRTHAGTSRGRDHRRLDGQHDGRTRRRAHRDAAVGEPGRRSLRKPPGACLGPVHVCGEMRGLEGTGSDLYCCGPSLCHARGGFYRPLGTRHEFAEGWWKDGAALAPNPPVPTRGDLAPFTLRAPSPSIDGCTGTPLTAPSSRLRASAACCVSSRFICELASLTRSSMAPSAASSRVGTTKDATFALRPGPRAPRTLEATSSLGRDAVQQRSPTLAPASTASATSSRAPVLRRGSAHEICDIAARKPERSSGCTV